MRVCTLNLPRIGHIVKMKTETPEKIKQLLDEELDKILHKCEILLRCHRKLIEEQISNGFLPFFKTKIMDLKRMFCTIGINGIYECVKELVDDPLSEEGLDYYKYVLSKIHNYAESISKNGILFNCEEVPAE